ncbi:MAG: amidohydrolase family protein [Oligoflexia bacterium]|nr:amidohydrolase family protein [Oligoflexia bacterium]
MGRQRLSAGLVDLHFHGAFGIDLMTASESELERLAEQLGAHGIAAFCPTTLSDTPARLHTAVSRLGRWISGRATQAKRSPAALPLGIHLEGPFLHPEACGAHPPSTIRTLTLTELDSLWKASQGTLKILTVAPETLAPALLRKLVAWCRRRRIILSLGHSRATEAQAQAAFEAGFTGVTHAWNALAFHHRSAGPLGAALGRKDVYVELIPDLAHVSATLIRWTRRLHEGCPVCFVSDAVPATGTHGEWQPFGPLKVRFEKNASRLPDGALAGGGLLLSESFGRWVLREATETGRPASEILKEALPCVTSAPLRALGLKASLLGARRVRWTVSDRAISLECVAQSHRC